MQGLHFEGLHLTYASEHLDRDASQKTRHRAGTQRATRDGSISRKPCTSLECSLTFQVGTEWYLPRSHVCQDSLFDESVAVLAFSGPRVREMEIRGAANTQKHCSCTVARKVLMVEMDMLDRKVS